MKRFFIFVAMLLTMTLNANVMSDQPPLILPGVEDVVLRPSGMHEDIDRSGARCICDYDPAMYSLSFICIDTGKNTELYLVNSYGETVDYAGLDTDYESNAVLSVPAAAGTYYIYLRSESYFGEARIVVE